MIKTGDTVIYTPATPNGYENKPARVDYISRNADGEPLAVRLIFDDGKITDTLVEFVREKGQ